MYSLTQFLLTPLREGRLTNFLITVYENLFLLTPLREGRLTHGRLKSSPMQFLLTPLREGRRNTGDHSHQDECISTHAPAGGATIGARLLYVP